MNTSKAAVYPLLHDPNSSSHTMGNRFLLASIAFQRAKQLQAGAVARVLRAEHKPTSIAVLEILANTVSWTQDSASPEAVEDAES